MNPDRQRLIMTTSWDDGHPLDLRVAELLAKHGLRGTFYVPLENSRPMLSPAQVRELATTFEIGAHTVRHVVLTALSNDAARGEIVDCKKRIEDTTRKSCPVFCFPSGRFADVHLQMLVDAGFAAARTVELLSLDRPHLKNGIAIVPTTIQAYPHSPASYFCNAAKRFRRKAIWNLMFHNSGTDWAGTAIALLERAREAGGVFHLWGHSWEIEEARQWPALDRVLAAMAEAARSASCLTNSELCFNGR
jgi:peptidoglycan/xylan/chitin deacetylase (PgdA/CDA1 family)